MQETCPKCNTPKGGDSCPRCGLVFAKFAEGVLEEGAPPDIVALWKSVEGDWSDRSRHAIFVENALAREEAGYAAGCYRRHSGDPLAEEYLGQINRRLVDMLGVRRSQRTDRRRLGRLIAMAVLFLLFGGITVLMLLYPDLLRP